MSDSPGSSGSTSRGPGRDGSTRDDALTQPYRPDVDDRDNRYDRYDGYGSGNDDYDNRNAGYGSGNAGYDDRNAGYGGGDGADRADDAGRDQPQYDATRPMTPVDSDAEYGQGYGDRSGQRYESGSGSSQGYGYDSGQGYDSGSGRSGGEQGYSSGGAYPPPPAPGSSGSSASSGYGDQRGYQQPVYQQQGYGSQGYQQGYDQQGYQQQPQYASYQQDYDDPYAGKRTPGRGAALAALIFGIIALLIFWFPFVPVLVGLFAIVLAIIALSRMGRSPNRGRRAGRGMAVTGLVTGIIAVILAGVLSVGYFVAIRAVQPHWGEIQECLSLPSQAESDQCINDVVGRIAQEQGVPLDVDYSSGGGREVSLRFNR